MNSTTSRQLLISLFTCATLSMSENLVCHGQVIQWARQLGTTEWEYGNGVSADGLGNVFISGMTEGALEGPNSGFAAYVSNYNTSGTRLWTHQLGTGGEESYGVSADGLGNVYISGVTTGNVGGPNKGKADMFVTKYDVAGSLQWSRQLGTTSDESSNGVSADGLGNVYITGYTLGSLGGASAGDLDGVLCKYNSAGFLQWTRQFGTSAADNSEGVSADGLGNVYVAGQTLGNLGGTNAGGSDAFLRKYNSDGAVQWTRQLGTSEFDLAYSVTADALGNVFIAGTTIGSLDGVTSGGIYDSFVSKYNASGTWQWTRQFGGSPWDEALGVSADDLGNVYVTGTTDNQLFYGGGNAFAAKYNTAGALVWYQTLGTDSWDFGRGISADGSGTVYVAGWTEGVFDEPGGGSRDAFLIKISPVPEPGAVSLVVAALVFGIGWQRSPKREAIYSIMGRRA